MIIDWYKITMQQEVCLIGVHFVRANGFTYHHQSSCAAAEGIELTGDCRKKR